MALSLKENIREFSLEQGIDLLGFAHAKPFLREREILLKRKSQGVQSPFEEPDVDLRCFPDRLLPGAKTIISCAIGYLTENPKSNELMDPYLSNKGKRSGVISRYARVRDYHHVLGKKLEDIAQYISRVKRHSYKIFVDTGSLMDKAVAVRAGLGWWGANTCFFTPRYGSWVFLGEILTDLDIAPDEPMEGQCDHCYRCVRACPSGALVSPFEIRPHRCLSYITQKRGDIPEEYQSSLGDRLFGCDTCQEVCPKNHGVQVPNHSEFELGIPARIDPQALAQLDKEEFNSIFKDAAMGWRGRNVLRRNALAVVGNLDVENFSMSSSLEKLLKDPSDIVKHQAMITLKRLQRRGKK